MDFVTYTIDPKGKAVPEFRVGTTYKDLMIKGGKFYAFYDESDGLWKTDMNAVIKIIDKELKEYAEKVHSAGYKLMSHFSTGKWTEFQKFVNSLNDRYTPLDRKIIFANTPTSRENYASKRLNYELKAGSIDAWDELIGTLYAPEERAKIEWAIGCILCGDSRKIQKFIVLHGEHGTGKSTILNIIQELTKGYWTAFSAESLGDSKNGFALEPFADNPLVAIDHDGDLSKITTNTRLNMIVSHESQRINEKFKNTYSSALDAFMFIGTNSPVKITDSKSGLIRRLIDVYPTGDKIDYRRYKTLKKNVEFELGAIAQHCIDIYESMGEDYYLDYKPVKMMKITNDVFDFLTDKYDDICKDEYVRVTYLWEEFKKWMEYNNIPASSYTYRRFRNDILGYFDNFYERISINGQTLYSVLSGLKKGLFSETKEVETKEEPVSEEPIDIYEDIPDWLKLSPQESAVDIYERDSLAQYAKDDGKSPRVSWDNCKTTLKDIDTSKIHFVKPADEHHIFIDFDCRGENGEKSFRECLRAAKDFPKTYAEKSKGGQGLHLHYIYDGDVSKLSAIFGPQIEVKVFPEEKKSTMRRRLSECNGEKIAHISSGLPFKEVKQVIDDEMVITEKGLMTTLQRCMEKEYAPHATITNVMWAKEVLDRAYDKGVKYDLNSLRPAMVTFASNSSNNATKALGLVSQMKFCSKEFEELEAPQIPKEEHKYKDDCPITFFDVEIFPNLFVICYKYRGASECIRLINPTPEQVKVLLKLKLVGFNNRDYDNHMVYAASMGYSIRALYELSKRIVGGERGAKFANAYNLSYTDIYDFSNDKMSLKKWEIRLKIFHLELGLDWDKPVPKELWNKVADYCCNDVIATEKLFEHLEDTDWTSRIILSELSGLSRNETTNNHTCQIIFGDNKHPQDQFIYTDLSKEFPGYVYNEFESDPTKRSTYRGRYPKEGGYVYAQPGYWEWVALLDVASLHPSTARALKIFGEYYTQIYWNLVQTRLYIKHGEIDKARAMFDGKIGEICDKYNLSIKKLDKALKIPINAVYGLTSAKFENRARDKRNIDNIVAKRGALFMINLCDEVMARGYDVAHIKTDSIKIPNADKAIIDFVMEYGKSYGYTFEHEASYEKMCLVNNAVYIAKYAPNDWCINRYGYVPDKQHEGEWTATGAQFAVPYVFKTLFSKEEVTFDDMRETFQVTAGDLYLDHNENLEDVTEWENIKEYREKVAKGSKMTKKAMNIVDETIYISDEELQNKIDKGHDLQFVGRVGEFTPIIDGYDAGILYRVKDGKNYAASGSTGYRWLESIKVEEEGLQDKVDLRFYRKLCDDAIDNISQYLPENMSFEEFAA